MLDWFVNGYLSIISNTRLMWGLSACSLLIGGCGLIVFAMLFHHNPRQFTDYYVLNRRIDTFQFIKRFHRLYSLECEFDAMLNREYHIDTKVVAHEKVFTVFFIIAGVSMVVCSVWLVIKQCLP